MSVSSKIVRSGPAADGEDGRNSPQGRQRRNRGKETMLRITVTETTVEERWILQGQLTKRSVAELVSSWRASVAQPPARCRIVDLNEVTSIDKSGEEALLMMVRDGATFVASGVYTKHLLDQLQARQTNQ
jgi:ABC-type transporter Mla MlaB component